MLAESSPVVAAAVAVSVAAAEVAQLRHRLSRARLAERQVIRREIHDGLGPALSGLRLGLQGARNMVAADPDGAVELLDALHEQVGEQVGAVRELSHQLLPPVLLELGLEAALEELLSRHTGLPQLHLEVDVREAIGEEQSTAAYGIVVEALSNARRHAQAQHCRVQVATRPAGLELQVADDGVGVDEAARSGVGTQSMRERAEEQGGSFEMSSLADGGTLVRVLLPRGVKEGDRA